MSSPSGAPPAPPFPSSLLPPSIDPAAAPVGRLASPAASPNSYTIGHSPINGNGNGRSASSSPSPNGTGFPFSSGSGNSSPDPLAATGRHSRRGERRQIQPSSPPPPAVPPPGALNMTNSGSHHPLMMNRRDSSPPPPMPSLLASLPLVGGGHGRDHASQISFGGHVHRGRKSPTNGNNSGKDDSFDLDLTDTGALTSSSTMPIPPTIMEANNESPVFAPRVSTNAYGPPVAMLPPPPGSAAMGDDHTMDQVTPIESLVVPKVPTPSSGIPPSLSRPTSTTPTATPSAHHHHNNHGVRIVASPGTSSPTILSHMGPIVTSFATPSPTHSNSNNTLQPPTTATRHQHSSSISLDYDDDGPPVPTIRPFTTPTFVVAGSLPYNSTPSALHVHHGATVTGASILASPPPPSLPTNERDSSVIAFPPSAPSSSPSTPKSTANLVNAFPSLVLPSHQQGVGVDGNDGTSSMRASAQAIVPSLFAPPTDNDGKLMDGIEMSAPPSATNAHNNALAIAAGVSPREVKEVRWANLGPSPTSPPAGGGVSAGGMQKRAATPASSSSKGVTSGNNGATVHTKKETKVTATRVVPMIPAVPLPRISPIAQSICWLMDTLPYRIWSLIITIIALLAADFNWAFLPKSCDSSTEVILLVCLAYWLVEIIVQCMIRTNYFMSMIFIMDVLSSLTLIIDIPLLMDDWDIDNGLLRLLPSAIPISTSITGLHGIVRTSSSLRFTWLAPLYRIFRIIRVGRFASYMSHENRIVIATPPSHPRKAVYLLHHHIYHMSIMAMLSLLLSLAIIDAPLSLTYQQLNTRYLSLSLIQSSPNDRLLLSQSFVAYHTQSRVDDLLYYAVNDTGVLYHDASTMNDLRAMEMDHLLVVGGSDSIIASFSLRHDVLILSACNFALTIGVMIGMIIWHWWSYRLADYLLALPLEQLTVIIRRFAGTICILSSQGGNGNGGSISQPTTPRGRHNSSFGHSPFPSFGSGGSFGSGTGGVHGNGNGNGNGTTATPSATSLSEVERQVVEGAVTEMTTVFKVNQLGEIARQKSRRNARLAATKKATQSNITPSSHKKSKTPRKASTDSNGSNNGGNGTTGNNSGNNGGNTRTRGRTLSAVEEAARHGGNTGGWDGTIAEQEEWDRQMGALSSLHDLGSMRDLDLRRTSSSATGAGRSLKHMGSNGMLHDHMSSSGTGGPLNDSNRSSGGSGGNNNGGGGGGGMHVSFGGSPSSVRYSVTDGYGRDRYGDYDDIYTPASGSSGGSNNSSGIPSSLAGTTRSSFVSPIKSDAKLCPELATFDALLHDPPALQHFRSFLQGRSVGHLLPRPSGGHGKPGLELLLFWQECQAFHHQTIANAVRIFSMFIDQQASTPVPISDGERTSISSALAPSIAANNALISSLHSSNGNGGISPSLSPLAPIDATLIHAGLFAAAERQSARLLRLAYQEFLVSAIADHFREQRAADRIQPSNRRSVFIEIDNSNL